MIGYFLSRNLCNVIGLLLPAYQTYKSLKYKRDQSSMLRAVFAVFTFVEFYADILISFLPFYYESKTLFLLYLAIPQTRGATAMYSHYLKPFLKAKEPQIDARMEEAKAYFLSYLSAGKQQFLAYMQQKISSYLFERNLNALQSFINPQPPPETKPVTAQIESNLPSTPRPLALVEELSPVEANLVENSVSEVEESFNALPSPAVAPRFDDSIDVENERACIMSPPHSPDNSSKSSGSPRSRLGEITNISPNSKAKLERNRKQQAKAVPKVIRPPKTKQILDSLHADPKLSQRPAKPLATKPAGAAATVVQRKAPLAAKPLGK